MNELKSRGYLAIPRYIWKLPLRIRQLYFELYYLAAYKPMIDRHTGERLEAGQIRCTRSFLAARLNTTVSKIHHDLDRLQELNLAKLTHDSRSTHAGLILTISQYGAYNETTHAKLTPSSRQAHAKLNNNSTVLNNNIIETIVACWNSVCGPYFPKVRLPLSERRARILRARLKELPKVEQWELAFEYLTTDKFHRGENDRGWTANFDYILRPDRAQQLLERLEAEMEGK